VAFLSRRPLAPRQPIRDVFSPNGGGHRRRRVGGRPGRATASGSSDAISATAAAARSIPTLDMDPTAPVGGYGEARRRRRPRLVVATPPPWATVRYIKKLTNYLFCLTLILLRYGIDGIDGDGGSYRPAAAAARGSGATVGCSSVASEVLRGPPTTFGGGGEGSGDVPKSPPNSGDASLARRREIARSGGPHKNGRLRGAICARTRCTRKTEPSAFGGYIRGRGTKGSVVRSDKVRPAID